MKMKRLGNYILALTIFLFCIAAFVPVTAADRPVAEKQAVALKQMGLFKGVSDTDFALDRAPTRTEALVMLIRVLGKESEALGGEWKHPFTDVAPWADRYVGYAYENGLTKGVSATEFGNGDANADMYITFVLRALGYDDSKGDFVWNAAKPLAKSVGILPDSIDTANFLRADVVQVSWSALTAKLKDNTKTLGEKLAQAGVYSAAQYDDARQTVGELCLIQKLDDFLKAALMPSLKEVRIIGNLNLTETYHIERENGFILRIDKDAVLNIDSLVNPVGCIFINDGTINISGTFDYGLETFTNNGIVNIKSGGTMSSGMVDSYNKGTINIEKGASLLIERGTQFYNSARINNSGLISVKNGGKFDNSRGVVENSGTITIESFFEGDIGAMKGTGTVNDYR